jgi:translation initiation factor IF-1
MAKDDNIEYQGKVIDVPGGTQFKVKVHTEPGIPEHIVLATLSGNMRKNKIRVVLGDEVVVAVSPYDPTKGRIVFRKK